MTFTPKQERNQPGNTPADSNCKQVFAEEQQARLDAVQRAAENAPSIGYATHDDQSAKTSQMEA